MIHRHPALFVPHGSPFFALTPGAAGAALAQAAERLPTPRAIVMVSAHWDTQGPTVGIAQDLETIYDFWGFPSELYDIRYPAHGNLGVAEEVRHLLRKAGFDPRLDSGRGLDHGAWIPLRLMYPEAGIPVVPLSIQSHLGPEHHFRLGRALAPLLNEGVLLVGSGNLTHNLRDFHVANLSGSGTPGYVTELSDWMWQHLAAGDSAAVVAYRDQAPDAARAHPSEDHILPLHVALGAAGPAYRADRLYSGVDNVVLAMDSYAFWPGANAVQ